MDLPSQFTFPSTVDGSVPSVPDEEMFKKQLKDYYNDMVRAQNAQQEELKETNYKLERALEEKSKMANEMKSMEAIRDVHVKQLASIQEEINALKGKSQSQTKEVERLMGNLAGKTDQLMKERGENERLSKENNALKDYFLKAQNAFRNAKLRVVEVEKTNGTLKESYNRLHQEYIELRTQWLKENESRPRGESDDVEKMAQELALAHTEINSLQEMLQAKTYELASYQDIDSWFQKEEKENQALVDLTKDIKEILSKRAEEVDSKLLSKRAEEVDSKLLSKGAEEVDCKSVGVGDELTEEGQEDKATMEQLTQQLDGIVEEMKSQMTEVDVKVRDDGTRPNFQNFQDPFHGFQNFQDPFHGFQNFQDPFHGRGKEAERKPMEQSWTKGRQERVDLSSASLMDEKLSPSSRAEKPKEVAASMYTSVSVTGKQEEKKEVAESMYNSVSVTGKQEEKKEVTESMYTSVSAADKQEEKEVEPGKQEEEQAGPSAGFQLPSWLTCNKN